MRKLVIILFLITMAIVSFAEPYRPYPVIYIHGYAANHYNYGNFGTVIMSNTIQDSVKNATAISPIYEKIDDNWNWYLI